MKTKSFKKAIAFILAIIILIGVVVYNNTKTASAAITDPEVQNLIKNGGFETGSLAPEWETWQDGGADKARVVNTITHTGTRSLELIGDWGSVWLKSGVSLKTNTDYVLRYWVNATGTGEAATPRDTNTGGKKGSSLGATNGWKARIFNFNSRNFPIGWIAIENGGDFNGTVYIDDVWLVEKAGNNKLLVGEVKTVEEGSYVLSVDKTKLFYIDPTLPENAYETGPDNDFSGVTFSYQWMAGGVDIFGATQDEYTLQPSDSGKNVNVRVSADAGFYGTVSSNNTAPFDAPTPTPAPPTPTPAPPTPTPEPIPQTGIADMTSTTMAMVALVVIAAVLWTFVLRRKSSR